MVRRMKLQMEHVLVLIMIISIMNIGGSSCDLLSLEKVDPGVGGGNNFVNVFERIFPSNFEMVWNAAIDVLTQRGESVRTADKTGGLITTYRVNITTERLKQIAQNVSATASYGGAYELAIHVMKLTDQQSKVTIQALIIEVNPMSQNPLGGRPLLSNGTLETELFTAIGQKL